jgi:hypothetical protein
MSAENKGDSQEAKAERERPVVPREGRFSAYGRPLSDHLLLVGVGLLIGGILIAGVFLLSS